MKTIDTKAYLDDIQVLVRTGHDITIPVSGGSMTPFLAGGRDFAYLKPVNQPLRRGDIVLYQRPGGQYVLHRIYRALPNHFALLGDAQTWVEHGVTRDQIVAVSTACCRKGKWIDKSHFCWWFFAQVWPRLRPFRRGIMKIYSLLKG